MAENTSSYNDTPGAGIRAVNHRSAELGRHEMMRENEYEPQYSKAIQKIKSAEIAGPRKRSSSFQITRVVAKSGVLDHTNEDGDSLDDLDETNTEDLSSDFQDISKNTDLCDQSGSMDDPAVVPYTKPDDTVGNNFVDEASTMQMKGAGVSSITSPVQTPPVEHVKDKTVDIQSRFKVVKIESKDPFKRGRWKCLDFLDPPASDRPIEKPDKPVDDVNVSGNSSTSSSVHYTSDVDDPGKLQLSGNLAYVDGHQIVEPQPVHPKMGGCDIQMGGSEHAGPNNTNLIQGAPSRVTVTGGVHNGVSVSSTMVDVVGGQAQMSNLTDRQNIIPMGTNISGQTMVDSQMYQQQSDAQMYQQQQSEAQMYQQQQSDAQMYQQQQHDAQMYQQQSDAQMYQQQPSESQMYQQQPDAQMYQQHDTQMYQQQPNAGAGIAGPGQSMVNQLTSSLSQTQIASQSQQSNVAAMHDAGPAPPCTAASDPQNMNDMVEFGGPPQSIVTHTNTPVTTTAADVIHTDYVLATDPASYRPVLEDVASAMPTGAVDDAASRMLSSDRHKTTDAILRPPLLEMMAMDTFGTNGKEDER